MLEQSSTTQNVWIESLYSRNTIACKLVLKVGQQRSKGHKIWVMPKIGGTNISGIDFLSPSHQKCLEKIRCSARSYIKSIEDPIFQLQ